MSPYEFDNGFVSNIFIRHKKDNSIRLILNLKKLNEHVDTKHFKMETLKSAVLLMKRNCFFTSCDLKDAYYSVNIQKTYRRFLRFFWNGVCYQFTCLPNGLAIGPRSFTKLLKCAFSHLRKRGYLNTGYIDDSLLQGDTYVECAENTSKTVQLFDSLGLTVHPQKSILIPTQTIEFLGFILNSQKMIVALFKENVKKF